MATSGKQSLIQNIKRYIEIQAKIVEVDIQERLTGIIVFVIIISLLIALASTFYIFLNMTFAFWLNELVGHEYTGFMVIAGVQFVLLLIVLLLRKRFARMIENIVVQSLIEEDSE